MVRSQNDPYRDERLSMTGGKGEEYGNLDDLIGNDEKEAKRILQAVNRAKTEEDPFDEIIVDRITNYQEEGDLMMRRGPQPKRTGVNMDDFIDSISVFSKRITSNDHSGN